MKNLLMISYPFPPNASAGAVRSERFTRYLPQFGWAVDVVTIRLRQDSFDDRSRLDMLGNDVSVHFTRTLDPWLWLRDKRPKNVVLRAIRSVSIKLFSFPDHMVLWLPFAVKKGLEICKKKKIDAIYSTSPPHSSHLAARILSSLTHKPWVADFRDPWTLNAYREKGVVDRLLFRIEKVLERTVLKNSSVILANTRANRQNLLKAFPFLNGDKVIHLPNGWEEFPERDYQEKRNGSLTIVHAGTFYPRFKPYGLLYALAEWRNGNRLKGIPKWKGDIKVILLGSRDEETKRVVHDLGLEDIVDVKPWVALEEARRIMSQADLLWASLGTGKESSTYIPSKLFEYIAARKRIIGFFPEGEAERLIRETGTGVVFTEDDTRPVLRFLEQVTSPDGSDAFKKWYSPVKEVIAEYHISSILSRLAALLDRALAVQ